MRRFTLPDNIFGEMMFLVSFYDTILNIDITKVMSDYYKMAPFKVSLFCDLFLEKE